jgi:hypothetical protein
MAYGLFNPQLMGQPQGFGLMDQLRPKKPGLMDMLGGGVPPQAPAPSYGERLSSRFSDLLDPSVAMPMAGALIAGENPEESFGGAFAEAGHGLGVIKKERAAKEQENKAMAFLQSKRPDLAEAVAAGMPISEAWSRALGSSGGVTYSKTPVYGTDANGKTGLGVIGDDGSFKLIDTGDFNVESGMDKVDLGTQWGLLNKRTGQIEGYMPKDIAGAAAQKEIGEGQGKAAVSAPGDIQAGQNALDMVESLRNDPSRVRGTGFSSILNGIPGTAGKDFQTKVDQAASGAFLTAIQQMRGLGALSNAEGSAATQAITRMNTATSEEAFIAALDDYEMIVRQGIARAQARQEQFGTAVPGVTPQQAPQGGNTRLRFNPATGELE